MQAKKWNIFVLSSISILFVLIAIPTIYYDPYFHYHAPVTPYGLRSERYQNDGIVKHFEYDALITGTSMTENFKTSEFDKEFGVNSIKVPFSGGSFREVNSCVKTAIEYNPNLKVVLRGLDLNKLDIDKDDMRYDSYPTYLYNNNILDDVEYILNKETLLEDTYLCVHLSLNHEKGDTFDSYARWASNTDIRYGKEAVLEHYKRQENKDAKVELTEDDKQRILDNVEQNILGVARDNPQITFYYFFTPYSIVQWDVLDRKGKLDYTIETQRIVIEKLLTCDNIKLYSWCDNYSLVSDLNNYKDTAHYGEHINSEMYSWMRNGKGLLTIENYEGYLNRIEDYYKNYDYDALFES